MCRARPARRVRGRPGACRRDGGDARHRDARRAVGAAAGDRGGGGRDDRADRCGVEVATGAGLGFAYHNHDFEFRVLDDGSNLWGRIAAARLPQEPDVGWLLVAGLDPVTVLGELAGRCPLVHAKDVRRKADGTWEDVIAGDGEADWPAIATAAEAAGATHIVVELDNPSQHPVDDVALCLATLRDALP